MWSDGQPTGTAIHATAVAIGGRALVLLGPSKSGKSRLAAALIARSSPCRPVLLVGDDRILLEARGDLIIARAHPRIAGFIERRRLGIVASPFVERVPVAGIVCLGQATMPSADLANFPVLRFVKFCMSEKLCDQVLSWFAAHLDAADGTQVVAKEDGTATSASKD